MAKQWQIQQIKYKGYTIGFKKQWDAMKQEFNYGVQIYDKNERFIANFYSSKNKKECFEKAKNIINK